MSVRRISAFLFILVGLLSTTPLLAEGEGTGTGSISFELRGPDSTPDVIGHWILIRPNNERTEGDEKDYKFLGLAPGTYMFTTELPQGASAVVEVYLNGELLETLPHPQVTLTLNTGDQYLFKMKYSYTRAGIVAVNSTPPGLNFTLKGPNNIQLRGKTPASYEGMPEGLYTAYFDTIKDCKEMPAKSDILIKDSRISLQIDIVCEALKNMDIGKSEQKFLEFVSVTINDKLVLLEDVPTAEWFATYIYNVAKAKIITGYQDAQGNPTGKFGPGDLVTIAQLSKIVHEASGIDEEKIRTDVQNLRAKGTWFERYFASSEQRWWEVWRDRRIDPERPATRAEVIATLLRALNVRTVWPDGKMFADVQPIDNYAAAIETAGVDGLVDIGGAFRPNDPINRAEMAKIVFKALDIYTVDTLEQQGESVR